jgi:RHS repeat-associated protein
VSPSFYNYDRLGTVRRLTNSLGAITDTYDYDAFGNKINSTGTTPNNYMYRGEQYDSDLELYYLRARYMNPLTGRFMSRDPEDGYLSEPVTLHKYLYVGGDPVNALSGYCRQCGVGLRQINPFRVRIHPTLKRSMLQLNWVADEFFVSREVWADVFCPLGIDHWPVISARTGEPLNSVVQLRISEQADLKVSNSEGESCSCCGRVKMPFLLRGFAPETCCIPSPIFRSAQYFGTGANAFNRVLVSAPLFREIQRHTLRGIEFYPCASNSRTDGAS